MSRLSLEETMNQLKARLEESEYKHALACEALDFYANCTRGDLHADGGNLARKVLNGVDE